MPDRVFYDGDCGLCHGAVKFLLKRDPDGSRFRYAPLQGPTFAGALPEAQRRALPDSLVILAEDGRLLVKGDAALRMGERLGGPWALLAALGRLLPRALRDALYDLVARNRARFFARPEGACPILPPALRSRFDP